MAHKILKGPVGAGQVGEGSCSLNAEIDRQQNLRLGFSIQGGLHVQREGEGGIQLQQERLLCAEEAPRRRQGCTSSRQLGRRFWEAKPSFLRVVTVISWL